MGSGNLGPDTAARIRDAVRKQERADAIQVIQVWRSTTGWSGEWFDLRDPKRPALDGGSESRHEIAFLIQDILDIERDTGLTFLHIVPRDDRLMVWYRHGGDGPIMYALERHTAL